MNEGLNAPAGLAGVVAKLQRGSGHLMELDDLGLSYMANNRPSFVVEPHPTEDAYWVTAHIVPPPVEIGVIFGDALHNFRSALDHLARVLVVSHGLAPRDRTPNATSFPIYLSVAQTASTFIRDFRPRFARHSTRFSHSTPTSHRSIRSGACTS